jgi:uncharacterized phiE125 gp8 family phage protein
MAITDAGEVRVLLKITEPKEDGLFETLISNAEAHIERQTHREFTAATATRKFDAIKDVTGAKLWLDEDLISITTLTNGDSNTIASSKYVLLPTNLSPKYAIKLLADSSVYWTYINNPEEAISVAGSWGYSTTVPADIKYAVQLLTAFYYRSRQAGPDADRTIFADGTVIAPAQAPQLVAELIAPYRKVLL